MMLWLVSTIALFFLATTLVLCKVIVEQEDDLEQAVAEILENSEERVYLILAQSQRDLPRKQILSWMRAIYREAVLLAVALGGLPAHLLLLLFNALFLLLWFKLWFWPNPRDLRLLLGGEMFILCQLEDD